MSSKKTVLYFGFNKSPSGTMRMMSSKTFLHVSSIDQSSVNGYIS
jgi:hypothetical protein